VQFLLEFVRSGDLQLQSAAVTSLGHLVSDHPANRNICLSLGTVPLLMGLLKTCQDSRLFQEMLSCMGRLCAGHTANQDAALEAGALEFIIEAANTEDVPLQHLLWWTLGDLCTDSSSNQLFAGLAGAVEMIISKLVWYENQRQQAVKSIQRKLCDVCDDRLAIEPVQLQKNAERDVDESSRDSNNNDKRDCDQLPIAYQGEDDAEVLRSPERIAANECTIGDAEDDSRENQQRFLMSAAFEAVRTLHCLVLHEQNARTAAALQISPLLQSVKGIYGPNFDILSAQVVQKANDSVVRVAENAEPFVLQASPLSCLSSGTSSAKFGAER
jgi:hypothetical protein